MNAIRSTARRALGLIVLLAGVAITASACVLAPPEGPGYAAPVVYGPPAPAVVIAPRVVAPRHYYHRYYYW